MSDHWRYVGFYPYKDFRTFLVMALPPALTVVVQWLILRIAIRPDGQAGSRQDAREGQFRERSNPFPHRVSFT